MNTTIILNAAQSDFSKQVNEIIACHANCLNETKLSLIVFTTLNNKETIQECITNSSDYIQEVEKITIITTTENNIELQLDALSNYIQESKSNYYIFPSNMWAKSFCTRLAYRIDASSSNNIIDLQSINDTCKVSKYTYANNCIAEFTMHKAPYCISLAKDSFELEQRKPESKAMSCPIEYFNWISVSEHTQKVSSENKTSSTSLSSAKFVVICGQGINSKEKIQEIRTLAQSIGAEFGVTRPVAMNAHESIDRIVGISGSICKADICISIATSGAGAYYAGIEKCKQIIAVNTNANAAIMEKADIIIEEDGLQFMQDLVKTIKNSDISN